MTTHIFVRDLAMPQNLTRKKKTPNAKRPTANAQLKFSLPLGVKRWTLDIGRFPYAFLRLHPSFDLAW